MPATSVRIPAIELIAALTLSADQAERDGLPGCASQVRSYLRQVEALPHGSLIIAVR